MILSGIFLLSGATSLVYQILWVRALSLTLGSSVYAISLVVAAFMAGLALGSAWFGSRVDRWGGPLRLYAFLEVGIGVSALAVPLVLALMARGAAAPSSFLGQLLASAWFPFVAGFATSRGLSIGVLYSVNTVGAVIGAAAAGFILIRALGIQNATFLAAAGNGLIFILAWLFSRRWPQPSLAPARIGEAAEVGDHHLRLLKAVILVYVVNGIVGLALSLGCDWSGAVSGFRFPAYASAVSSNAISEMSSTPSMAPRDRTNSLFCSGDRRRTK